MIPVIAIVGRPNVGKSTLFNRLTKTSNAIVADSPGLTRDRQYGRALYDDHPFIVIDTGGLGEEEHSIDDLMGEQTRKAISEANAVLFLVDARSGLTGSDENIASQLRSENKNVICVVNKIDGLDPHLALAEFHKLGFESPIPIAATHGRGIQVLLRVLFDLVPLEEESISEEIKKSIRVSIIGRPNVGKSTLVNRIVGEDRVAVFDEPGTTRDSIFIPLEHQGQHYTLIDTAGLRRRRNVTDVVEKFSAIKSIQAIESSHVVVFMVDARTGIVDQDLKLLGLVLNSGRSLVLAINKWDGLSADEKEQVKRELKRRLVFLDYAKWHFISALYGSGVRGLFHSILAVYHAATKPLSTPEITKILEKAVEQHPPPLVKGRRIKLRYAHLGGHNPPIIVVHGSQVSALPASYMRYLENIFRETLDLVGTPLRIELRSGKNPYEGKKNRLTPRQTKKRQRMMKFVKKKR